MEHKQNREVYDFADDEASVKRDNEITALQECTVTFNCNKIKFDIAQIKQMPDRVYLREIREILDDGQPVDAVG